MDCCDNCRYADRMFDFKDYIVCLKKDKHMKKTHLCEEYEHREIERNPYYANSCITK